MRVRFLKGRPKKSLLGPLVNECISVLVHAVQHARGLPRQRRTFAPDVPIKTFLYYPICPALEHSMVLRPNSWETRSSSGFCFLTNDRPLPRREQSKSSTPKKKWKWSHEQHMLVSFPFKHTMNRSPCPMCPWVCLYCPHATLLTLLRKPRATHCPRCLETMFWTRPLDRTQNLCPSSPLLNTAQLLLRAWCWVVTRINTLVTDFLC